MVRCADNGTGGSGSVTAAETWDLVEPETQNHATLTFSLYSDNTMTAQGEWVYVFSGNDITCAFLSGSVTSTDSLFAIRVSGSAAYPPDTAGNVESSAFTMVMEGVFQNGVAAGDWDIDFSKEEWQGWVETGRFSGSLRTGSGITD
jgi:hypothetical protein